MASHYSLGVETVTEVPLQHYLMSVGEYLLRNIEEIICEVQIFVTINIVIIINFT